MERDRQRYLKFFVGKRAYLIAQSAGRKRNVAQSYIKSVGTVYKRQKFFNVIVIVKRLAYSHHYDIGNLFAEVFLRGYYLSRHLGRKKISRKSVQGRRAEGTAHTAACL